MVIEKLYMLSYTITIGAIIVLVSTGIIYFHQRSHHSPRRGSNAKHTIKAQEARGIIFGRKGPVYVYSPAAAEGHIFVCGGSGTGKTSALLIPSLRTWDGTSCTIDISGDISANVVCDRKLVYAPCETSTVPYNVFAPIDALETDADRTEALNMLAWLIMPEEPNASANSAYFQNGGRAILIASLIWGYHTGKDFIEICEAITDNPYQTLFKCIDLSNDFAAKRYINQFEGSSENSIVGCKQNADRAVSLFSTNARAKAAVRRPRPGEVAFSCNSIEDYNIFVKIPDAKLEVFAPLLHIITSQVLNYLADRSADHTDPVLLALDEFVSLGKLEITPALRKLRKKYVRIMILTQSTADIDELYGKTARMTMMNNFTYKVILSAGDTDSQRYFADLIGMENRKKTSITSGSGWDGRTSSTTSTERAYIIEPADLANLGNELVLLSPDGYEKLRKNFYFK